MSSAESHLKYSPHGLSQLTLHHWLFIGIMEHQKTDWRMYLNNYLQGRYGHTRRLTWSCIQSGPPHDTRWQAVAYFDGVEYGSGVARDRGTATEIAAEAAYRALTAYYN